MSCVSSAPAGLEVPILSTSCGRKTLSFSAPPGLDSPKLLSPPGLTRRRPSALDADEASEPNVVLSYAPPQHTPRLSIRACKRRGVFPHGVSQPMMSPKKRHALATRPPQPAASPKKRAVLAYGPPSHLKKRAVLVYGPPETPKKRTSLGHGSLKLPRTPKKAAVICKPVQAFCSAVVAEGLTPASFLAYEPVPLESPHKRKVIRDALTNCPLNLAGNSASQEQGVHGAVKDVRETGELSAVEGVEHIDAIAGGLRMDTKVQKYVHNCDAGSRRPLFTLDLEPVNRAVPLDAGSRKLELDLEGGIHSTTSVLSNSGAYSRRDRCASSFLSTHPPCDEVPLCAVAR